MKTPPFPRIALAFFLVLSITLLASFPALAESTPGAPLLSADFGSSQWQLLEVHVDPDSRQALLSILWRNAGASSTSFAWTYDLFLTQQERRCQPIPLPSDAAGDDPSALIAPGGEQLIRMAFLLPNGQADVLLRLDEGFGQGYTPLSATYSPATGQITGYTLPQPPGVPQAIVTPQPTPMPPTPVPEFTQVPPGEATAIPLPIPEGENPSIPMLSADFLSSALQVVYVNVFEDSGTAVLYLQWQNTGASPTSFEWAYDLYVSQGQRRCQPVPLPEGEPSDDPQALLRPGEVQFIGQAFSLPNPQEDFQVRVSESFGGSYGPLMLTYSPATRQIGEYTLPGSQDALPQATALPEPEITPLPELTAVPEPVLEPEPTVLPGSVSGETFLLDGRIPFGVTSRRLMGLMGRMPDNDQDGALTFLEQEYAFLPSDWTFFLDADGKLTEMFIMFRLAPGQGPGDYMGEFDRVDAYLTSVLGAADLDRELTWRDGVAQRPGLSPGEAIEQGLQELTSNWYPQGMTVTHVLGTSADSLIHFVFFFQ